MVHELCLTHGLYLLNSINPYRLEGQKTIGFEAVDQLGCVPDRFVLPVGNAGNISAVYKGLLELEALDFIDRLPKMTGIQAAGFEPGGAGDQRELPRSCARPEPRDPCIGDPDRCAGERGEGAGSDPQDRRDGRIGDR